jgi:hypothetical protein
LPTVANLRRIANPPAAIPLLSPALTRFLRFLDPFSPVFP